MGCTCLLLPSLASRALVAQEEVQYKVFSKLGLDDRTIRTWFNGPAFLTWSRGQNEYGSNICGPLPQSWMTAQWNLQRQVSQYQTNAFLLTFFLWDSARTHTTRQRKLSFSATAECACDCRMCSCVWAMTNAMQCCTCTGVLPASVRSTFYALCCAYPC
jgi:hypothetical protein